MKPPKPPLSGGLQSETIQLKKSEKIYETEISNQTSITKTSFFVRTNYVVDLQKNALDTRISLFYQIRLVRDQLY